MHQSPPIIAYVYVLVRRDLRSEQQIVQCAHAALESAYLWPKSSWSSNDADETFLVLLGVDNVEDLEAAHERLTRKGVRSYLFYEPDHALGHTALASEPIVSRQRRKIFFPYEKLVHYAEVAQRERSGNGEVDGSMPPFCTIDTGVA